MKINLSKRLLKFKKVKALSKIIIKPIDLLLVLLSLIFFSLAYQIALSDKFYPLVFIGDTNISLLIRSDAAKILNSRFQQRLQILEFDYQGKKITVDFSAQFNPNKALDEAFLIGRDGTTWQKFNSQLDTLVNQKILIPEIKISLDQTTEKAAEEIYQTPQEANLWLDEQKNIHINESKYGQALDKSKLETLIAEYLIFGVKPADLPITIVEPKFSTQEAKQAALLLENIKQQSLKLTFEDNVWEIDVASLYYLLDLTDPPKDLFDQNKLNKYINDLAFKIDRSVQEPLFKFDASSQRVTAFKPAQEGRKLNQQTSKILITQAIKNYMEKNISLPVEITKPKINTESVNDLGINELLGRGISHFTGSIPNRIYNIGLTAAKINGVLIAPEEIFSFNNTVGDISVESGFRQAYVIKSGRTVLDDGGGVCQDSTTLFRAVLNAGLPVLKRTAHAYRVGYYEQGFPPGLDATVFAPSVDFQFKNNTTAHILIQVYTVGATLYVDLYGTSDGRIANITKPIIANQTPPPPELRQDDPELPKGEVKQVDWAAWGANVTFKRTVKRGGETLINETFKSNYRPWQAIYLVGTKEN